MIASVASGLGGRFFDELRDKRSLCYTVHAFAADRRLAGTFGAYIATSPEQEDAARDGLLAEFRRLRDEPVTAEELERAQDVRDRHARDPAAERRRRCWRDIVDAFLFGSLARSRRVRCAGARRDRRSRCSEWRERYFDPSRRVEGIVRGTGKKV